MDALRVAIPLADCEMLSLWMRVWLCKARSCQRGSSAVQFMKLMNLLSRAGISWNGWSAYLEATQSEKAPHELFNEVGRLIN